METKDFSGPRPSNTNRERRIRWKMVAPFIFQMSVFVAAPMAARAQTSPSEYQVKAAYVFNFLKFVEYPEDAFPDPIAPIVIGVVGDYPFGNALAQVVIGKTVQGRDLVVRDYRDTEYLRGAQILFISDSERKKLPQILAGLRGASVLTVADMDGFLEAGGMVQFFFEHDRVRFAINIDNAAQARLKMSSKLLSLAKVVGSSARN